MREDEIANRTGRVAGWLPLWLPGWQTGRVVAVMASIKTTCGFSSRADLIRNIFPLMSLLRGGEERKRKEKDKREEEERGKGKRKTREESRIKRERVNLRL